MTEVLTPAKWGHRMRARWRAWLGFCPRCNSDAPHVYDCEICNDFRGHERHRLAPHWLAEWLAQ